MERVYDGPSQAAGRREPLAQEDVRRGALEGGNDPGWHEDKVVKPSQRREMGLGGIIPKQKTALAA